MRRNVVFERGRGWRAEDDDFRDLHLRPDRGAAVGEYGPQETSEFSDAYYGPGDNYARRDFASGGYSREEEPVGRNGPRVLGVVGRFEPERNADNRSYGRVQSYGELRQGGRSWADLGVSSTRAGQSGITEEPLPSYRGVGPKGYTRSDERLTEEICERLTEHPRIDASDIDVQVEQGEVTLTGTVRDKSAKWHVEDLVMSCRGVTEVHNRLKCEGGARS
jgi:hypothetical protein